MSTLPLQHQEIGELSKLLRLVETFLTSEREASRRKMLDLEQEARGHEEKIHSLLEQLCLLEQRDEAHLEGQMKVNEEETQQVGPALPLWPPRLTFQPGFLQHRLASKVLLSSRLSSAA